MPKTGRQADGTSSKKDYAYRSTWKHKLSRARNLARRGGLTKQETVAKRGRLPRSSEWWGPEADAKAWERAWIRANPKPAAKDAKAARRRAP